MQQLDVKNKELIVELAIREKINVEFKNYVEELNKSLCDYIVFNEIEKNDIVLIFFAGFTENFYGLKRPNSYKGKSIYFRDKCDSWYENKLDEITKIINLHIITSNKIVLIGQSMGAYAALYCSSFINNSICLAFSPQTFNRVHVTLNSKILRNDPPYCLINLHDTLTKNKNDSKKYIIVGTSEHYSPSKRFWGDLLFAGYMLHVPNINVIITEQNTHIIYGLIIFDSLLDIILKKYDILYINMTNGSHILNEELIYAKK